MRKFIGVVFALIYIAGGLFLAAIGSVHGPKAIIPVVIALIVIAVVAFFRIDYVVSNLRSKHSVLYLLVSAIVIGVILMAAIFASWGLLIHLGFH